MGYKTLGCPLKKKHVKKGSKKEELKKVLQTTWDELDLKNPMKRAKRKSLTCFT